MVDVNTEGRRQIRVTFISPGAVESELAETISDPVLTQRMKDESQDIEGDVRSWVFEIH
jgi:NADP-dependent 3-hydroxy acid dehydrogenase YdfG